MDLNHSEQEEHQRGAQEGDESQQSQPPGIGDFLGKRISVWANINGIDF